LDIEEGFVTTMVFVEIGETAEILMLVNIHVA
jgi:hypothetical protein